MSLFRKRLDAQYPPGFPDHLPHQPNPRRLLVKVSEARDGRHPQAEINLEHSIQQTYGFDDAPFRVDTIFTDYSPLVFPNGEVVQGVRMQGYVNIDSGSQFAQVFSMRKARIDAEALAKLIIVTSQQAIVQKISAYGWGNCEARFINSGPGTVRVFLVESVGSDKEGFFLGEVTLQHIPDRSYVKLSVLGDTTDDGLSLPHLFTQYVRTIGLESK